MTLIELAERCEKAEGLSFTLDALITIALDPERQTIIGHKPGRFPRDPIYGPITEFIPMAEANGLDAAQYLDAPRYTTSIDAALTLVPEDRFVGALSQCDPGGEWYARIECHSAVYEDATAATPALALSAAALRARAS